MKKNCILLLLSAVVASSAIAATEVSYEASSGPLQNPDGNSNTVDVWSFTNNYNSGDGLFDKGNAFANASLSTPWQIYCYGSLDGSFAQVDHTFDGGALTIGQTVSIAVANQNVGSGGSIGFELHDSVGAVIRFGFNGGDADYFIDAPGGSGFTATSSPWQIATVYTVNVTITGAGTFHLTTTGMTNNSDYNGTYDTSNGGALSARVYAFQSGGSGDADVTFNNLSIVPEPGTFAMLLGGMGMFALFRRRRD
jgi:hypothetical protein